MGVTTGRKRRCGWFDASVVRYAHALNGFSSLNLTKLDVLDDLETVRLGVGYKIRGELLPEGTMPSSLEHLAEVEVVYEGAWGEGVALVALLGRATPASQPPVMRPPPHALPSFVLQTSRGGARPHAAARP